MVLNTVFFFVISQILEGLDHHNIIRLHYMYSGQQSYYMVLEHASGGDLLNDIVCRSTFTEQTAREIFDQILAAVAYLHEKHIVHRVNLHLARAESCNM